MKPDWKDAPEWAMWLAVDEDGEIWWFKNEPALKDGVWSALGMACRYRLGEETTPYKEPKP